jgi:hypothetical protein
VPAPDSGSAAGPAALPDATGGPDGPAGEAGGEVPGEEEAEAEPAGAAVDAWLAAPGCPGTGRDGGSSRKSPEPEVTVTDSEGTGSAGRLIWEGRERCDS